MEGSGNRRLLRVYNRLVNELHLVPRFGLMQPGEMQRSNRKYHQILDKIAAGEPEGAAEAMRCHTNEQRRKMMLSSDKFDPNHVINQGRRTVLAISAGKVLNEKKTEERDPQSELVIALLCSVDTIPLFGLFLPTAVSYQWPR